MKTLLAIFNLSQMTIGRLLRENVQNSILMIKHYPVTECIISSRLLGKRHFVEHTLCLEIMRPV